VISRILLRLSLAWFAVVASVWVLGRIGNSSVDPWDPHGLGLLFFLSLPSMLGLVLSWVFLPRSR